MKFLKPKFIVSYIIIIIIAILAVLYYTGGLKITSLIKDNIPFDETGFIDFSTGQKDENGNPLVLVHNKTKVIAETATHALIFNEETTVAKVVDKRTCTPAGNYANCSVTYQTAKDVTDSALGANLLVYYAAKSNGKAASVPFDTMRDSVKFKNTLTGETESHYKIKYIEGGVQILYDIGRFSANDDYFPKYFNIAKYNEKHTSPEELTDDEIAALDYYNRHTIEERFRGNVQFTTVIDTTVTPQVLSFNGKGTVFSLDAANYIREHNLATITTDDVEGLKNNRWYMEDIDPIFYDSYGTHLNSSTSPCTNNPFFSPQMYQSFSTAYYSRIKDPNDQTKYVYGVNMSTSSQKLVCYKNLYTSFEQVDVSTGKILVVDENGDPIIRGGYHARNEDGEFLYDEDGKPVQALYTLDKVAEDNAIFNIQTSTQLQRFQVCLQLLLTEEGLKASIIADSLRDLNHKHLNPIYDHDSIMTSIQFLKEMTTSHNVTGEGFMLIPDGSGAIINFNNGKADLNYSGYNKRVYGDDKAFVVDRAGEDVEKLMFGMYGFVDTTAGKGIMTVVEKGAPLTVLSADTPRGGNKFNTIYYTTNVRENEFVTAGTGWNAVKFPKWSQVLSPTDITYNFIFLENTELSYVGLANSYRSYLINRYNLSPKDTTTTNATVLNLLGAFERFEMLLGIKYMKPDSLTTFSQAKTIVEELLENDVTNLEISYSAWTNKEMEYETTRNLRASNVLGAKKDLLSLASYLENENIPFYPELFISSSKGFDYPFGSIKYTTRSVGNMQAIQYPFNPATLFINKKLAPTYYLRPSYYQSLAEEMLGSYRKFGIQGAYLPDLGNLKIGDYAKKREIFSEDGMQYQMMTLAYLQEQLGSLLLSAPFDFAFPYIKTAVNVPIKASTYGIFDQTIPFYQLVASGLFDYTTPLVNGTDDKSNNYYFVKALETGSNLYFCLSFEDPKILLQTNYTQYYKTYYQNWKNIIIDFNNRINTSNIHGGRLVNHERIAKDISKVTYSNGVVLVVNSSNKAYQYGLETIEPYKYISIGG